MPLYKEIIIRRIDADDLIHEHNLTVFSGTPKQYRSLPFGIKKPQHEEIRENARRQLLAPLLERLESEGLSDGMTAGEEHLVRKNIRDKFNQTSKLLTKHVQTADLLLQTFDASGESLEAMLRMYNDLLSLYFYSTPERIRELIVFNSARGKVHEHTLHDVLDDIRFSHAMFNYSDFSLLEPESLALAKKLLAFGLSNRAFLDKAVDKKNERDGVSYDSPLYEARREIFRHTPHVTPALATLFIEHPERVDDVVKLIRERGVPVHLADELIQEMPTTPMPLSDGAL